MADLDQVSRLLLVRSDRAEQRAADMATLAAQQLERAARLATELAALRAEVTR